MLRIKSPQDLGSAITFAVLGLGGLWFGLDYERGTAGRMGPGYFPMLLSFGLILFALLMGWRALTIEGPPIDPVRWRPVSLVLAAILVFALLIQTTGLAVAAFAVALLAALAWHEPNWKEAIAVGVFISLFCVLVFVYGLKQPIPIFGPG
jgi:hypothetical protein